MNAEKTSESCVQMLLVEHFTICVNPIYLWTTSNNFFRPPVYEDMQTNCLFYHYYQYCLIWAAFLSYELLLYITDSKFKEAGDLESLGEDTRNWSECYKFEIYVFEMIFLRI